MQPLSNLNLTIEQIAQDESLDIQQLASLLKKLPVDDTEEITYLEIAGECVMEVSSLIDDKYPELPRNQRMVKKYKLISKLLALKAEQLE